MFVLRALFWMPPLLHAIFGASPVGFGTHFWASLLGYLVPLLLVSYFGPQLFAALRAAPPAVWIGVALVVLVVALLLNRLGRRRASRRAAVSPS